MRFPNVAQIIELHEQILDRTGGERGVLSRSAVDSALHRAQWGPFFGPVDLADRAALLLRGICQDHPFVDGNKRTAFEAVDAFLDQNGATLWARPEEITDFMVRVAQGGLDLSDIAEWFRTHVRNPEEGEGA